MRLVISLGGNALGSDVSSQKKALKYVADCIAELTTQGHEVVIVHGNGPQVGMIKNAFTAAHIDMPLAECGAMSQGYIGYHIQNALKKVLPNHTVVTLISQIEVSSDDKAFQTPTKPIGPFYTQSQYDQIKETTTKTFIEDSGRGYRQVVASPRPLDYLESDALSALINPQSIIICGGGGGIPVIRQGNDILGVEAVIDKDFASALIAQKINADRLVILTAVDYVYLNYNQPTQKALKDLSLKDAKTLFQTHEFAKGSMGPKLEAAIDFTEKTGHTAIIGSLMEATKVFEAKSGTIISNETAQQRAANKG